MSAHLDEVIGDLRALLDDVRRAADCTIYGVFCGDDPRQFTPDPEASTDAEREAHRIDCERAERGEPRLTETACKLSGGVTMMRSGYGLGITSSQDETLSDFADRLERAIDQLGNLEQP